MKTRWDLERWAFGAARLALRPEPYAGADLELGLWHGLALAADEWTRSRKRAQGAAAFALLLAGLAMALAVPWLSGREAASDLEIVMLETPALVPPAPIPEPEPIAAPEPEIPPPPPEPAIEAPRTRAPEKIAARPPEPPPEPAPIARPAPAAKPVRPPAPVRVARPVLPPPPPAPPAAAPPRPAPLPRALAASPRPFKPSLGIDAVASPVVVVAASPPVAEPARSAARAPATRPASPRPAPRFDLGAPAAPAVSAAAPTPAAPRAAAPARAAAAPRAAVRPTLALPAFAAAAPARDPVREQTLARVDSRAGAPEAPSARARSREPALRGVPLGSLASCVSDREEDALKQQLVALVGQPAECVSAAGRYRFVETRNLNAFLLWVERAPSRLEADRCVELAHALACVKKRPGGESKRG